MRACLLGLPVEGKPASGGGTDDMSKAPAKKSASREPSPIPAFLVACVLIGLFTYRLTVPAHVSPLLPELVLTIVFDIAMVAGVVAVILTGSFLWRALVDAHEYPMRSEQVMTMLIDLGLMVGLVGMRGRVPA